MLITGGVLWPTAGESCDAGDAESCAFYARRNRSRSRFQRIEKELGSRASVFFERLREVTDKCEHHVRLECRS